jgi:hypothetical protein
MRRFTRDRRARLGAGPRSGRWRAPARRAGRPPRRWSPAPACPARVSTPVASTAPRTASTTRLGCAVAVLDGVSWLSLCASSGYRQCSTASQAPGTPPLRAATCSSGWWTTCSREGSASSWISALASRTWPTLTRSPTGSTQMRASSAHVRGDPHGETADGHGEAERGDQGDPRPQQRPQARVHRRALQQDKEQAKADSRAERPDDGLPGACSALRRKGIGTVRAGLGRGGVRGAGDHDHGDQAQDDPGQRGRSRSLTRCHAEQNRQPSRQHRGDGSDNAHAADGQSLVEQGRAEHASQAGCCPPTHRRP